MHWQFYSFSTGGVMALLMHETDSRFMKILFDLCTANVFDKQVIVCVFYFFWYSLYFYTLKFINYQNNTKTCHTRIKSSPLFADWLCQVGTKKTLGKNLKIVRISALVDSFSKCLDADLFSFSFLFHFIAFWRWVFFVLR